jgi:hypothetical protein
MPEAYASVGLTVTIRKNCLYSPLGVGEQNFSEEVEEVDSESEEDSHGATDEKPRELSDIRRLTIEDEVDKFKEGKCLICHKRDTSLSTAETKGIRRTT